MSEHTDSVPSLPNTPELDAFLNRIIEPELAPIWPTTTEQAEVLGHFMLMLKAATGDGGKKRAAGLKPSWKVDPSHEGSMFSHITKWKRGEKKDPDSGVHPLVHLAWRALAIAFQETNEVGPEPGR